jgi:hypothetical protein
MILISIEFKGQKLDSKGLISETSVHYFPIRGKNIYLHIIKRRLLYEYSNKVVTINSSLVASATRITSKLIAF